MIIIMIILTKELIKIAIGACIIDILFLHENILKHISNFNLTPQYSNNFHVISNVWFL